MKFIRSATLLFICFLNFYSTSAQQVAKITKQDYGNFIGNWQGTLTYLDYTSNKPYTMPAGLEVREINGSNTFIFINSYPNENNANSVDTIVISKNGRMINEEKVITKRKLKDGNLEIVTEVVSVDGNAGKPAVIRHTYTVGAYIYINKKEVQFIGEKAWIKRHEYSYRRKK